MTKILFKFEEKGQENILIENVEINDSILEIAQANNIELHHNCGGVCACSTCHIYLDKGDTIIEDISDKEEDFIDRAKNPKLNSRLSCQCIIKKNTEEIIEVTIPDQTLIHGE